MTADLLKQSKKLQSLYHKSVGKPRTCQEYIKYIKFRANYNSAKRQTKYNYFEALLSEYQADIRKTWRVLNVITGRANDKTSCTDAFKVNGNSITNKKDIANEFCTYFSNIGKQYAEEIPPSRKTSKSYLTSEPNSKSIYFNPTDPFEIQKIIKSFKAKKSCGDDGISMELLKNICESCCVPIAMIVNLSLEQGIVPDGMKLAKVIPVYKAKSRDTFTNYRPISLLSNISKILEKVVHKRLYSFITKHDILYDGQYGFRSKHSTIDALTEFVANVLPVLDNGGNCLAVYLDLSKAFDTIKHSILLAKLEHYGIRGKALDWFKSYLAQRRQYVSYGGVCSNTKSVEYGVPQGSVLGPLLFILYSNDLAITLKNCHTILFADDTTIYTTGTHLPDIFTHINNNLEVLNDWFRANKLSANPSKTKTILYSKRGRRPNQNLNIYMDGQILERVKTTKFLGVHFDEHFTWEYHIRHCRKKILQGTFAINTTKHILSEKHLKILYYSLVYPYLHYGILLWGNALIKHIRGIQIAQKKCVRAIFGAKFNASSSPIFKQLGLLKFLDIYELYTCLFMYNFVNEGLPRPLLGIYQYHRDIHDHNTRHSTDPRTPSANSDSLRKSFLCQGPKLWASLDGCLKDSRTKSLFKTRLKIDCIDNY